MGQAEVKPITLSPEDVEILNAGENFHLLILYPSTTQTVVSSSIPSEADMARFKINEVYICQEKLLESLLLSHDIVPVFKNLPSNQYIAAMIPIFNDEKCVNFVAASWLIEQLFNAMEAASDIEHTKLSSVYGKVLNAVNFASPAVAGVRVVYNDMSRHIFSDYFGEYKFSKELHPFGISWDEYEASRSVQYPMAYRLMRGYIPTFLVDTNADDSIRLRNMLNSGLPLQIIHRLLHFKILWLLCMHTEDILQLPWSFLSQIMVFDGLDIIELSALWFHLPPWKDLTRFLWRARLKLHLDNLVFREKIEGLEWDLTRHRVYEDDSKLYFDPDAAVKEVQTEEFTAIEQLFTITEDCLPPLDLGSTSLTPVSPQHQQPSNQPPTQFFPSPQSDKLPSPSSAEVDSTEKRSLANQDIYCSDMFPMRGDLFDLQSLQLKRQGQNTRSVVSMAHEEYGSDEEDDEEDIFQEVDLIVRTTSALSSTQEADGFDKWVQLSVSPLQSEDTMDQKDAIPSDLNKQDYVEKESGVTHTNNLNTAIESKTMDTLPMKSCVTSAADAAYVDFELMPDQAFLSTMEEIKNRQFVLRHRKTIDEHAEISSESSEEDDTFDQNTLLLQRPFNVRPEFNRENTFMKTIDSAMMNVLHQPLSTRSDNEELKSREIQGRPGRGTMALSRQTAGRSIKNQLLNTTLSFLVNNSVSDADQYRTTSSTSDQTLAGQSPPDASASPDSKKQPTSPGTIPPKTPMTNTRSTILSYRQDMMRAVRDATSDDDFQGDAMDIVAALSIQPRASSMWYDHQLDIDTIGSDDYSSSGSDGEWNEMDDAAKGEYDNHQILLDEHEEELRSFIARQKETSPSINTVSSGQETLFITPNTAEARMTGSRRSLAHVRSGRSTGSRHSRHSMILSDEDDDTAIDQSRTRPHHHHHNSSGCRLSSGHHQSHGHRSFPKRKSIVAETVSSCLVEFLSEDKPVSLIDSQSPQQQSNSVSLGSEIDAVQQMILLLHEEADSYYHTIEKSVEVIDADEGEETSTWSAFTASLTAESRSDPTYESMVHEYVIELILTGDIDKAENMLQTESNIKIPVSKATSLLHSMLVHYDAAISSSRTHADPPAIEVIQFLVERLHAHIDTPPETRQLLGKYYPLVSF